MTPQSPFNPSETKTRSKLHRADRGLMPLGATPGSRFMPWIIGLMGYLGCLALAAVIALAGLSDRWQSTLAANLTVELDPIAGIAADEDGRLGETLSALRGIAGIADIKALTITDQLRALEPWLEDPGLLTSLQLPILIEVSLQPDATPIKPTALEAVLTSDIAGLRVVDHAPLVTDLLRPAQIAEAFAYAILTAVFLASLLLSAVEPYTPCQPAASDRCCRP